MKYLSSYKLFENLDKANKLIKDQDDQTKDQFNYLFDYLRKKGLQNYAGFITRIILSDDYPTKYSLPESYTEDEEIDNYDFIKSLNYIKLHKINVDNLNQIEDLNGLNNWVEKHSNLSKIKKEILDICPSNLREELRQIIKNEDYSKKLEKLIGYYPLKDKKKDLISKGSRYKSANEWIEYIIYLFTSVDGSIEELKESNIELIYEDNDYIIYRPLDFYSYKIMGSPRWCTIEKSAFEKYFRWTYVLYINKKNIKLSFCSYVADGKFEVYDYNNVRLKYNDEEEVGLFKKWLNIGYEYSVGKK